jgi:uncharacterized protein
MSTAAAPSPLSAHEKETALIAWFRARGSVLIGFSGGVDSAYLAVVALEALGPEHALAVIGRSASYPLEQWTRARDVAAQFNVPVLELDTDELNDPRYAANPSNRCYFCKTELWSRLLPIAAERGIAVVIDGTNADDLSGHRPGKLAAAEQGVESPLAIIGFTKDEIRELSQARGIPTWSQPSSPCLASRIPTGIEVTPLRLGKIEAAEKALRALGVTGDLRVRYYGETARLEMTLGETERWRQPAARERIRDAVLGAGFSGVEIDVRGFRSGSLHSASVTAELDVLFAAPLPTKSVV